ncbi:MAG: cyclic nucleotide-binding domain-containing protein [Hyphomicrobiaceae bacterium]
MAIDQVLASLLRVPVFSGLKPLQITEIGRRAQRCAFGRGEAIIEAGEPGDAAYLVLSGEAGLKTGGWAPLEPVEPGSLLGELAMFVDHAYSATVVAQGWVDCLKLERSALHAQMSEDPDLADRLAQVIRDRLTRVATELQEVDELLASIGRRLEATPRPLLPPPGQGGVLVRASIGA